jgi:hemerythrin-like metal-binding protein
MVCMSLFKWSNAHSVYLPEIDAEHRALYRLGDELHKALLAGAVPAQMQPILANLLESAEQHFRHEERLMRAIHYNGFAWHKHQHDAARKRTKALAKSIEGGDSAAAGELLQFLSDWLRDHMAVADRMMGARLRNYLRFNTSLAS